jgi:pyruvate dehydrogenase E1 component
MNTTPDGEFQTYKAETARTSASTSSAATRAAQDGRAHVRRRDLEPQARRPRLPQGLRGVQGGHRAHRPADGDPGQDHQGLDARPALRGPQRDPPDEEADPGRPQGLPRPALPADPDKELEANPYLPPYYHPGEDSDEIQYMLERRARSAASCPSARAAKPLALPGDKVYDERQEGLRQAEGRHHDGVRPAAQGPDEGQGDRQADRADHPGRGPHVRHGLAVPDAKIYNPHGQPTSRSTASCCCPTRSPSTARSCTRASTRPARWPLHRAGTSYATHGEPMIPVYIFYSMFGFQRTGDRSGRRPTRWPAASCSAPPPAAPR